MKSLREVGRLLAVAVALLAPAGTTRAQQCPAGCDLQKRACLQTGRVAKLACKRECRASAGGASLGSCLRGCADQLRTAKSACASDHAGCMEVCPPAPPPGSCTGAVLDGCGQALAACARAVVTQAMTCVEGCATAPDRLVCLQDCAATAQQGLATCAADFGTCIGTCACPGGCDDGDPCTHDACVNGTCVHACICLALDGTPACCPGPAALCVRPCGGDASGVCGGLCPPDATCETVPDGTTCGCVSGVGGPCGGNIFAPPPVCAAGLVCQQTNPDATGVCVALTTTT